MEKVNIDAVIGVIEKMKLSTELDKDGEPLTNSEFCKVMDVNETLNNVLQELYNVFIKPNVKLKVKK